MRQKKILISLGHPAQYHFFKHTIKALNIQGHSVMVVIKTKDVLEQLLQEDGLKYVNIQTKERRNDKIHILLASLQRSWKVIKLTYHFKPDILLGTGNDVAHAGWLFRKPCITTLEDDIQIIKNLTRLTYPFTTDILVPTCCNVGKYNNKKIGYAGYMKLAYLHPNEFTPDIQVLKRYGIDQPYILIRLVKLTAHHDFGAKGLNSSLVKQLIHIAHSLGFKVYISSETNTHPDLNEYRLSIKVNEIHHIMAYASLLISDSQSMSVEAAMLGIPNVRFNNFAEKISVLNELQHKYQLTYGVKADEPDVLKHIVSEWLSYEHLKEIFIHRRELLLSEKIDVTAFLTWFITNYPESRNIMKSNPSYQFRFK